MYSPEIGSRATIETLSRKGTAPLEAENSSCLPLPPAGEQENNKPPDPPTNPTALLSIADKQILLALPPGSIRWRGPLCRHRQSRSTNRMAAETTDLAPPSPPPPVAPTAAPSRPRLSGFEQLDGRVKELTSSQAELLERIQKLKQEVQNWRSNIETQVKTCQNELQGLKKGLDSEVEQLKSEMKAMRSAIQEEKGNLPAQITSLESNDDTEQAWQTQDQVLKVTTDASMEDQTATQA